MGDSSLYKGLFRELYALYVRRRCYAEGDAHELDFSSEQRAFSDAFFSVLNDSSTNGAKKMRRDEGCRWMYRDVLRKLRGEGEVRMEGALETSISH